MSALFCVNTLIDQIEGILQVDTAVKRREAVKAPPADIRRYVKATGLMETRYVRMLSSLCAETYYLNKLNVRSCSNSLAFAAWIPSS